MSHRPSRGAEGSPGNEVSGIVAGPSIQALDIHGGVHFHGPAPPAAAVPRQVAAPIPHFAGRRLELGSLRRAAARSGSTVVILSGPGGVGKTTLARQWAHESADTFTGGQLWADLGGLAPTGPADPAEVLRSFLRALGVSPDALPAPLAELTALYRSQTAGRSLLTILDDAYSAAQVRVLVPASPTSMTIVTSRSRLSGLVADGATLVDTAPLAAEDSVALLTNIVGRTRIDNEREQAGRLAALCAGLPIALCLTAAKLSSRPRLTLARVVSALEDETDRLVRLETPDQEASVHGSFELSYRALNQPAAALYRRLSLHPGREFGPGPVSALLPGITSQTSTADAGRLIDLLLEANLLEEVAEDRFRFHDLIQLHARQRAAEDDTPAAREAALVAMLEWYLAAASAADAVVTPYRARLAYTYRTSPGDLPGFTGRDEALAWLDGERVTLGAAGRAALDHRWAELAWHLSDVLWPLQLYRKSADREDIDVRGLAAAQMWGHVQAEGHMLKRLGRTLTTLGRYEKAEQLLRSAVARWTEAGNAEEQADAEEMLALSYRDAGRQEAAVVMLRTVLAARRELANDRKTGLTLINLGTLLSRRAHVDEAVRLLREAAGLLERSVAADPYNPVRVRIGLAAAYLEGGDLVAADRTVTDAVEGMQALGVAAGEADALELAGRIAERRGDPDRSRRSFQRALQILESRGSPDAERLRRRLAAPPAVQDGR